MWNEETDRVVVRGDVHSLTFYPEDTTTHTDAHKQAQDANTSSDTTITYVEEDGIQGRGRPASGPSNGQSLSLSRISHADDSGSHFGGFDASFDGGSGAVDDHTPPMREGDTDDTMSGSGVFRRPVRQESGREQWMTTSDFGSPSSSSTHNTSMPSLEQQSVSFQEGSVRASVHQTSSTQGSGQDEWSSVR